MADVKDHVSGRGGGVGAMRYFHDNADGTYSEGVGAHMYVKTGGVWVEWSGALATGDIEIGAVELKNGTDDTRATVTAANALKVDGSAVSQPVVGNIAVGQVDSGAPVKMGGIIKATNPSAGNVGNRTDAWFDSHGQLAVFIGRKDQTGGADSIDIGVIAAGTNYIGKVRPTDGTLDLTLLNAAPGSDTGQVAMPVRVVSSLTVPVSLATNTPDVTDRAARLLGIVDKGKVWDGTNIAAVKAASAIVAATDPSLVVGQSPQRADASTLCATTISGANAGVTLTINAAAAGLFHYITHIEIVNLNPTASAIAGSAVTLSYTTTNLPGSPAWSAGNALAAGGTFYVANVSPTTPIKSTTAATNTTIVAPAIGTGGLCRITVWYYTAP